MILHVPVFKTEEGNVWQGSQRSTYGEATRSPNKDLPCDNCYATSGTTSTCHSTGIRWGTQRGHYHQSGSVAEARYSAEQVTQIIAIACEPPSQSGRPVETWTGRELADEAVRRGIVTSISTSQVNRYLAEADLQPHRSKYWLNSTEKDPEVFEKQVQTVCNTYLEAPELYFQYNTHTVSVDEMTGVQALERNAETTPMKPGQPARIEFEYTRHGTLCLIGNWHVVEGQMIAPTIRPTRTEEDFLWHIFHTIETDPDAGWVFVSGQFEYALQRKPGTLHRHAGRDSREYAGPQRQVRHSPIDGQP